MSAIVVFGFSNRPKVHPEKLSRVSDVDRASYVPLTKRIEAMLFAGERLQAIKAESYDSVSGQEPIVDLRLRKPGADLLDVLEVSKEVGPTVKRLLRGKTPKVVEKPVVEAEKVPQNGKKEG